MSSLKLCWIEISNSIDWMRRFVFLLWIYEIIAIEPKEWMGQKICELFWQSKQWLSYRAIYICWLSNITSIKRL